MSIPLDELGAALKLVWAHLEQESALLHLNGMCGEIFGGGAGYSSWLSVCVLAAGHDGGHHYSHSELEEKTKGRLASNA